MAGELDVDRWIGPVQTSRVSGTVRAMSAPLPANAWSPADNDIDHPSRIPARSRWFVAMGAAVTAAVSLVAVDIGLGIVATMATVAIVLRRLVARASFAFGEGFLPYRSDLGWPRGVQEDDDVHWIWAEGRRG